MSLSQENQLTGIGTVQWEDEGFIFEAEDSAERKAFLELLEAEGNGNGSNIKEGTIVNGKVSKITSDYVIVDIGHKSCLLYTSPSPRDGLLSRMPSSA